MSNSFSPLGWSFIPSNVHLEAVVLTLIGTVLRGRELRWYTFGTSHKSHYRAQQSSRFWPMLPGRTLRAPAASQSCQYADSSSEGASSNRSHTALCYWPLLRADTSWSLRHTVVYGATGRLVGRNSTTGYNWRERPEYGGCTPEDIGDCFAPITAAKTSILQPYDGHKISTVR
jgi:hypothetical protein